MNLILVRGLPGSGKSTIARVLDLSTYEADDYFAFFSHDGVYAFDPSLLPQAHADCQRRTRDALEHGLSCVVSNTFAQRWEMQPYIEMAEELGARLTVLSLFDGGCTDAELAARNKHGVPVETITAMRERWEHDWRNSSPKRPVRKNRFKV